MNIYQILTIIIVHYLADFVLQANKWQVGKSSDMSCLLSHTITYSGLWAAPACLILGTMNPHETTEWYVISTILFFVITFVFHTITDYLTIRLNKSLIPKRELFNITKDGINKKVVWFPKGENYHRFFIGVGFDQVLHYVQLFATFELLRA